MTLYVTRGHLWRIMSRMGIHGTLLRVWAVVADKKNSGLVEAPEFGL
jgi:hypothetical protein